MRIRAAPRKICTPSECPPHKLREHYPLSILARRMPAPVLPKAACPTAIPLDRTRRWPRRSCELKKGDCLDGGCDTSHAQERNVIALRTAVAECHVVRAARAEIFQTHSAPVMRAMPLRGCLEG